MRESKISVIIPVHNVVRYLPKCINSVRNQTYSNLEIILVDDGSTDGSGEVCDRYKEKDKRVRVIHQDYGGVSSARNIGLSVVTGSLVGFIDSDDWIDPDYYEVLEACMQKTCADIVVSGCYYVYQDAVQKDKRNEWGVLYDRPSGLKALSERKMRYTIWDKLYRKSLFSGINFVEGRTYEDVLATYQLISRAECIACTNYYGYHQRMRAGSITHILGGEIEGFSAHYEVWQDAKNQNELGHLQEDVVDGFFKTTVEFAYSVLFINFITCRKNRHDLFLQIENFWKGNREEIASLNRKLWLATYAPFPFKLKGWILNRFRRSPKVWGILKKTRRFFNQSSGGKLFE